MPALPDFWEPFRGLSSEDWHCIKILANPVRLQDRTIGDVGRMMSKVASHLAASVDRNSEFYHLPEFPQELRDLHAGCRYAAAVADPFRSDPPMHRTYWPDSVFMAPWSENVSDDFVLPPPPRSSTGGAPPAVSIRATHVPQRSAPPGAPRDAEAPPPNGSADAVPRVRRRADHDAPCTEARGVEPTGVTRQQLEAAIDVLPPRSRQALPVDERGRFFVLTVDHLYEILGVEPAAVSEPRPARSSDRPEKTLFQDGARCLPCISTGMMCQLLGHPFTCEKCSGVHGLSGCNMAFSAPALMEWAGLAGLAMADQVEDLRMASAAVAATHCAAEAAINELHYRFLRLLSMVLRARDALPRAAFLDRFLGATSAEKERTMEAFLRVAMIQQLSARDDVHRRWRWNRFTMADLCAQPVGPYDSGYDFYEALAAATVDDQPLGYFLVPQDRESDVAAQWVQIQAPEKMEITLSGGARLNCGVDGAKVRARFYRKVFAERGVKVPEHLRRFDDDDVVPRPLLPSPGFLGDLERMVVPVDDCPTGDSNLAPEGACTEIP
ncbi:hypothetical protein MSAN_02292200 [Mycena sanguinolenta]|uniref:Uncharacterized protein n=1 Tax=Mycena sanguinolenta TaxID=230812 RepID=A0A8H6X8K9_9AGAR|nr:hypothetical protein MSAN_02292200 [Mycena sanguinolenta]